MDIITSIIERRSIRKFKDKEIPNEAIEKILKSAMYAPSGGNAQPWDFIFVTNKDKLNSITNIHPYSHALKSASCAIIVCGNKEKEKFEGLWIQDCSAATQNILLSSHSLGIGSVWLGLYPELDRVKGVQRIFNLPNHITPFAVIALGYSDEKNTMPDRFNKDSIHYDKW